jgi:hypothetical protein
MPSVVVMGSCLTNLPAIFLMSDYKWERFNNAAVLRSDHFVEKFLDRQGYMPSRNEFRTLLRFKAGQEREGERWLRECYRDSVGHLEIALEKPGLFETLETKQVDLILMDNLHDTHGVLLHRRANDGEPCYSMPYSLSHCDNEDDLKKDFYYDSPLEPEASVANWLRIVRFVRSCQPYARILFFCAHACTSLDLPERHQRIRTFHTLFRSPALELGISVLPPFDLPPELLRMPQDRDHFDMQAYRAMAGYIMLTYQTGLNVCPMITPGM